MAIGLNKTLDGTWEVARESLRSDLITIETILNQIKLAQGAVAAAAGGTGLSSFVKGDLLYANTTTTLARLADVATGNALISGGVGAFPSWGKIGLTTHVSGILPIANGGTNISTYTQGDLLYASAANVLSKLAIGAVGKVIRSTGTIPAYTTFTIPDTFAAGDVVYGSAINVLSGLAIGTVGKFFRSNGTIPAWSTATLPDTAAQGDLLYGSASNVWTALTKDTNATRYLSNTGTTNNPAWAQVALTTGVSGTLPVGNGGTGTATAFTQGSVVFAGVSGVYSQDNSKLFWDDSNFRLGIRTASPQVSLHVAGQFRIQRSDGDNYFQLGMEGGTALFEWGNPGSASFMTLGITLFNNATTLANAISFVPAGADATHQGVSLGFNMLNNNTASFDFLGDAISTNNLPVMRIRPQDALSSRHVLMLATSASSTGDILTATSDKRVGLGGVTAPTATLHLTAGTATASTAPLKFNTGTNLTTAEAGAMEFTTDDFFLTITTGAARKGIVLDDGARLTSGKIPIASTNGRLIDGQTPLAGAKVYYVADSSGGAVTRKLTFTDGILTAET